MSNTNSLIPTAEDLARLVAERKGSDLLFPDVDFVKPKRQPRPRGLRGDIKLHYDIVLTADRKNYRLHDLYFLAHQQSGRFSYEQLDDEQLGRILAHIEANEPPIFEDIKAVLTPDDYERLLKLSCD